MFFEVWQSVLPVFIIMGVGYFFGFFKEIDLDSNSEIVLYLTSPCLALTVLLRGEFRLQEFWQVFLADLWVTLGMAGVILIFLILSRRKNLGWLYLPVLFMNSGNLGFPLATMLHGTKGLTLAVIFNLFNAILIYSLGIVIVRGKSGFFEFLKLPYIYAVLVGVFFNYANWRVPAFIFQPISVIGGLTIPLMLLSLGYRLHDFQMKHFGVAFFPAILRTFGGFILGLIFVNLFKIQGISRDIILLLSALPAAITSYMLAEKYNFYPEQVATSVTLSNFLGIIFVPLVIMAIKF